MIDMIHPILLTLSLLFYISTLSLVQCFISPSILDRIRIESSLYYKSKPHHENDGVISTIPNFPSIPDHIKNVYSATTLGEYKRLLIEQQDKLIVTRFYMTNCKACLAMTPSFYRLVRSKPNVIFVDIPISKENKDIHLQLGVETVPFAHIHHPAFGLVEERKISRKHWDEFEGIVQSYIDGECDVTKMDCSNPFVVDFNLDPNYL